jgi:hypothetical protein
VIRGQDITRRWAFQTNLSLAKRRFNSRKPERSCGHCLPASSKSLLKRILSASIDSRARAAHVLLV